jgi:stage II sporulation protein D
VPARPISQPPAPAGEASPAPKSAAKPEGRTPSRPSPPEISAPQEIPASPPIRIGISTGAREVRISAPGEYFLIEKIPEAPRQIVRGEVQVRLEEGTEGSGDLYRVQVAALSKAPAAEELKQHLSEQVSSPVVVLENTSSRLFLVRVGEFRSREEAQDFAAGPLKEAGYADARVVRETHAPGGGELRMALRGSDSLFRVSRTGFLFSPSGSANFLRLDGKSYRGIVDLTLNKTGRITIVNQLPTEEYLFGVVPAELSPTTYPEPAALAAQSIAARTYALKNLGRYRSEGFDLTTDVRTQVYGGVAAEREMSSDAVLRTFGLALYYQDKLIDAMYSSTCGGRTEDFSEVFETPDVPYLRSTTCTVENRQGSALETTIAGAHHPTETIASDDGSTANRNLELAEVLGLTNPGERPGEYLSAPAGSEEIRKWISLAKTLAQNKTSPIPATYDIASRAGFFRYAAESLYGMPAIEARISASDAEYYLNNLKDGGEVPKSARFALAYVIQQGIWHAYPDNSARPADPIRRSDALVFLTRWIESVHPSVLMRGVLVGPAAANAPGSNPEPTLAIKMGSRVKEYSLAEGLRLFKLAGGASLSADSLKVIGNEKLTFHLQSGGRIDLLEVELNPNGAASDRYSPVTTWDAVYTKHDIAQKLAALAPHAGELQDLRPSRIGKSGRAVQMEVLGAGGSVIVNGLKFRNALGLKDTLFTITRQKNADGEIESFVFHGRGWGHGVGLCQVGAFGMARAGRSYQEILKSYYQGVELRKAY